MGLKVVKVGL